MYKKGKVQAKLLASVTVRANVLTNKKTEEIVKIVDKVMAREEAKFFNEIARVTDRAYRPRLPGFEKVTWHNLSPKYRRWKGNNRKWYSGLGKKEGAVSLRDFLKQYSVSSFYPRGVVYDDRVQGSIKGNKIRRQIRAVPGISRTVDRKPFNVYDNSVKNPKTQEVKVFAKNKHTGMSNEEMRPLFAPMTEYFVRHKIPRAINAALREKGLRSKKYKFES